MTVTTPCYRHAREVWLAACPDCTAWHLAASLGRCTNEVVVAPAAERPVVRTASCPADTGVPPAAALRLVA
jgi:hypothetical protein